MKDRFLRACWREPVDRTPVWFMRQAGRYMPEYQEYRMKYDVVTMCKTPKLSAEVSLLPLRLGVDAAILFADIMLPLEGMGISYVIKEGVGPVISNSVRSRADADSLLEIEPERDVPYVLEATRLLKKRLHGKVPLIGFSGAPFTLASYMVEGRPSKTFVETKKLMYREPTTWRILMEKLSSMVASYLEAQIEAGADAVQLFDSWVGCLSPQDYEEFVLPYTRSIFDALAPLGVPRIHFGTGTSTLLELMKKAGGDVFGVDWRIPLDEAWSRLGEDVAIQGNLEPAVLLGDREIVEKRAEDVLRRASGRPGHIFNLGHGVLPDTPPERVAVLVDFVHSYEVS
ncbi:MAG: uroporphyrinogen decarboxylase [Candidatus Geothermarchaeales archaeon]